MSNLTRIATFEEEDDDLELLRLAALKSLNIKKDIITPPSSSHGVVNIGKAIQVIEHAGPVSLVRNTTSGNNFNTTRRVEKLEVSEPYVPQKIVRNRQWVDENVSDYVPYVASRVAGALAPIAPNIGTNVQLSPRSLAFVSQNTSILLRRKGEVSPGNYNRSPISPYRASPGRWSNSPPPNLNSPIYYDQRRSVSFSPPNKRRRSPSFRRSPIKRRSVSRSPTLIKYFNLRSPLSKRKASKSPIRNLTRHNIGANKITTVKSPRPLREHQKSPTIIKNRRNSPSRHNQSQGRGRRSLSPMYNRNPSLDAKITAKWHQSHSNNNYSSSPNNYQKGKKRSRSPIIQGNVQFNRGTSPNKSRSGSPVQRKLIRRSKEVSYNGNQTNNRRRNSPTTSYSRKLNKNTRRGGNKYRSPVRRRTRSKSPKDRKDKSLRKNDKNSDKDKDVGNKLHVKHETKIDDETKISKKNEHNENDKQKISNLDEIDKISDNESSLSDDDENDDKTTNNDNDEIDLFASEESESENEGRFKSSTKKCERNNKSSTLSFSKLGNSSTVTLVGSLKDISSSNTEKNRSSDRHSRNNRDYRRGETYKKLDNRSNSSRKIDDWKDNKTKDATNDKDKSNKRDDNNGNNMRMFKSTFQAVVDTDIKDRKYSPKYKEDTFKDSKDFNLSSKENLDKRIPMNKKTLNEDDKDITNIETSTNTGIVASALNTVGKKSIHLRLGPSSKATQSGIINDSTSSGLSNMGDVNSVKVTLASAAVPINSCTGNSNVTSSGSSWKTKKTPWRKSEKEIQV